jgi:hypothetical protein
MLSRIPFSDFQLAKPPRKHDIPQVQHAFAAFSTGTTIAVRIRESMAPGADEAAANLEPSVLISSEAASANAHATEKLVQPQGS